MENETLNTIYSRRSVRLFTGEAVPRESLIKILKAAMAAPSAVNIQPWSFVVVTKRETLDQLCANLPYAKMLDKAGAALVVCGVPDKDKVYSKDYWIMDCSAASENILLACHALGLGAVWTAVYVDSERVNNVRKIFKHPRKYHPPECHTDWCPQGEREGFRQV